MTTQTDAALERLLNSPLTQVRPVPTIKAEDIIDVEVRPLSDGNTHGRIRYTNSAGKVAVKVLRYKRTPLATAVADQGLDLSQLTAPVTTAGVIDAFAEAGITLTEEQIDISRSTDRLLIVQTTSKSIRFEGEVRAALARGEAGAGEGEPEVVQPPLEGEDDGDEDDDQQPPSGEPEEEPGKSEPNTPEPEVTPITAYPRIYFAAEPEVYDADTNALVDLTAIFPNLEYSSVEDGQTNEYRITMTGTATEPLAEDNQKAYYTRVLIGDAAYRTAVEGLPSETVVLRTKADEDEWQSFTAAMLMGMGSAYAPELDVYAMPNTILSGKYGTGESSLSFQLATDGNIDTAPVLQVYTRYEFTFPE